MATFISVGNTGGAMTSNHLHSAVSLGHWYLGQALLKIANGHYEGACIAIQNADKFLTVVGREVAPDLEPRGAFVSESEET